MEGTIYINKFGLYAKLVDKHWDADQRVNFTSDINQATLIRIPPGRAGEGIKKELKECIPLKARYIQKVELIAENENEVD